MSFPAPVNMLAIISFKFLIKTASLSDTSVARRISSALNAGRRSVVVV